MTDYLSSVLDELVPECADEDGDWARVVSGAGAETSAMTRRRMGVRRGQHLHRAA